MTRLKKELSFLFDYFDRDDLNYFYENLQERIYNTAISETFGNEKLQGYIWKMMSKFIEDIIPHGRRHTRVSKQERMEFIELIAKRMEELNRSLHSSTLSEKEKETVYFSLYTLKFILAIVKQDELFG